MSSDPPNTPSTGSPFTSAQHDDTPRVIGPVAALAIVAGSMLGVGIFLFPGHMAFQLDSAVTLIAMMLLGGLFALAGSVACGELGAMMPRAGGDYVFQREALGPSVAFASGWVLYAAIFAGSNASLAVAVFQYQFGSLFGVDMTQPIVLGLSGAQLGAIGVILLFTWINHLGAQVSARTQTILTLTPIALLLILALALLLIQPETATAPPAEKPGASTLTLSGVMASFLFVNFIFSGWINIIYVASEVKEPGRNIPRSMIGATAGVTGLYLLLTFAFIAVLGFNGLAALSPTWTDAGTGVAQALGSELLQTLILVVIAVAILTSINATVLAGGRVGFAMARDKAFIASVGKLSPSRSTPSRSLWFLAAIAIAFIATGTFESITKMASIAMFVTGGLTVLSHFVLRRTRPDAHRPYRASLHPWLPALYLVLATFAIVIQVRDALTGSGDDSWYPLLGVGILAFAWVGHLIYRRLWKSAATVAVLLLTAGALMRYSDPSSPPARAYGVEAIGSTDLPETSLPAHVER